MIQILHKNSKEFNTNIYLVTPKFQLNNKIQTLDGDTQKTTILQIPFTFQLTNNKSYFKIELSIIIGLCITIKLKENYYE